MSGEEIYLLFLDPVIAALGGAGICWMAAGGLAYKQALETASRR